MKWRKLLWLIPVVLILGAFAKPDKYKIYNNWDNIRYVEEKDFNPQADTLFVICTNRYYQPQYDQPLADDSDPLNRLQYMVVTYSDNEWRLLKKENLKEAVSYLPKKDVLVYVEGMGKTFPMDLQRSAGMATQYNLNVIQFEYPSIDPRKSPITNFYFAYNQARDAAPEYSEFIEEFDKLKRSNPDFFSGVNTSLFHHSMGNRMIKEALENNMFRVRDNDLFDNVILNAACVPQRRHREWIEKINFADNVYINYNKKDFQLNGAMVITFDKMLGARFEEPLARNATYVDFNDIVDSRHSNFLNMEGRDDINPDAHRYYNTVLHGLKPNWKDSTLYRRNSIPSGFGIK